MNSIVNEIEKIRFDKLIEATNYNRYMLLSRNSDRTQTAYCFSVPIYNEFTKSIVDLKFHHNKFGSYCLGSSATITIADTICLKNDYGTCHISSVGQITKKHEDTIFMASSNGCAEVSPTLNGLLFKVPCSVAKVFTIRIMIDCLFESIRSNDKCFSIMREKFIPFITVSCVGTLNARSEVIAPCMIDFQKVNDKEYVLTFENKSKFGKYMAYEINMHEAKLFQDTTVESLHPTINNAFGGTAFLGNTEYFGEQWLYSRLDFSNMPQLQNKKIIKAVLHIPKLNKSDCLLTADRISSRFCSFGSNWKNKIPIIEQFSESFISSGYHHLDITALVGCIKKQSESFVIRAKSQDSKQAVISTGDSFFKPQIIEIKYE